MGVVENLVSVGAMPVGVADVEGDTSWVSAAPLDKGVTDVGMRGEPSIDALVALEPDLVIATTVRSVASKGRTRRGTC